MTVAKIEISVGSITFSGEGNEDWLEKQLDKMLKAAPTLAAINPPPPNDKDGASPNPANVGPLASFLSKKSVGASQVKRFLVTAEWLHLKGGARITTADVNKALSEANQKRLGNASDCLSRNVTKGHVEKDGKHFYVTPDGRATIP